MFAASVDICVDDFHHQNHREFWCQKLLNPAQRKLPENWNTQEIVRVHVFHVQKQRKFRMATLNTE